MIYDEFKGREECYTLADVARLAVGGAVNGRTAEHYAVALARLRLDVQAGRVNLAAEYASGGDQNSTVSRDTAIAWFRAQRLPVPVELDEPRTIEEANKRLAAAEANRTQVEARVRELDARVHELEGQLAAKPGEWNAVNAGQKERTMHTAIGALVWEVAEHSGRPGRINGGDTISIKHVAERVAKRCKIIGRGMGESNLRALFGTSLGQLGAEGISVKVSLPIRSDLLTELPTGSASVPKCEGQNTGGTDKCKSNTKKTTAETRPATTRAAGSRKSANGLSTGTTSTN